MRMGPRAGPGRGAPGKGGTDASGMAGGVEASAETLPITGAGAAGVDGSQEARRSGEQRVGAPELFTR